MKTITYNNKVALNENPSISVENKVTDDDMNEIKEVANNHAQRDSISAYASSDGSSSSTFGVVAVSCDTVVSQAGTGLTLTGGNVVVGSGISKVKVSATLVGNFVNANSSNALAGGVRLLQNGSGISAATILRNIPKSTTQEVAITLPPIVLSVSQGDTISIGIYSSSSYITKTAKSTSMISVEAYDYN